MDSGDCVLHVRKFSLDQIVVTTEVSNLNVFLSIGSRNLGKGIGCRSDQVPMREHSLVINKETFLF